MSPARRSILRTGRRGTGCSESDVYARVQASSSVTVGRFTLPGYPTYATTDLAWWDIRQYFEDYWSGNVGLWRILCGFIYSIYHQIAQAGIGVGPAMEWLYDTFHPLWRGTLFPWKDGTIPAGHPTPTVSLNLQPGELVRVKSHQEILQTVTIDRQNRGMRWDAELVPYCGGTYRVLKRVTRIVNEKTGEMQEMKNPCIVLDSVVCEARYAKCRLFCPRGIYSYWREIWLERASEVPEASNTTAAPVHQ